MEKVKTRITLHTGGQQLEIEAAPNEQLARAIWLSGALPPAQLCGGLGCCGRCRVRFISPPPPILPREERFFGSSATAWRLACQHTVPANTDLIELEIPQQARQEEFHSQGAGQKKLLLAVDLGTTTIEWQAFAPGARDSVAWGEHLNPQAPAGADVISRIGYADSSLLGKLVWQSLNELLLRLQENGYQIIRASIAGNTAMLALLLGLDCAGLRHSPYSAPWAGGETIPWAGNDAGPPTLIPPIPGPFVGADISAGLLALMEKGAVRPFLLADLGTNAELALYTANELFLTSVPLGPAMEGIGPECGHLAQPGVATRYSCAPAGIAAETLPGAPPGKGISATGYLSLLASLFNFSIMDPSGHFREKGFSPYATRVLQRISADERGKKLALPDQLWLRESDVEMLLKVKAAFAIAVKKICAVADISPCQLATAYLAGSISSHVQIEDLLTLGFFPLCLGSKIRRAGNCSLAGARLLCQKPELLPRLADLCAKARILNLATDKGFEKQYFQSMQWGNN